MKTVARKGRDLFFASCLSNICFVFLRGWIPCWDPSRHVIDIGVLNF